MNTNASRSCLYLLALSVFWGADQPAAVAQDQLPEPSATCEQSSKPGDLLPKSFVDDSLPVDFSEPIPQQDVVAVLGNLPAMARRSLAKTARQEFQRQYENSIATLDLLLKDPCQDPLLTSKIDQVIEKQSPRCRDLGNNEQELWPLPPAIPYCLCSPMAPEVPLAPDLPPEAQEANHVDVQRESDISTQANQLLIELERMQARSEQACNIADYLEALELLQDRTMNCLTAKKVVSTVEFDTPAIFTGTTFTGDRNGPLASDLTIIEGMKLDVYGDGRYALHFNYLRPSKPVTLHLQMQCWIDEESGWKTLTLPPMRINPAHIDPKDQVNEYSYLGHSRALERSSGYVQKARRTGTAVIGYGLRSTAE